MKFKFEEEHSNVIKQLLNDYIGMSEEGLQILSQEEQSQEDIVKILNFLNTRPAREALTALNAFNASIAPQIKAQEDNGKEGKKG